MKRVVPLAVLAVIALADCSNGGDRRPPVPRRNAYPRIEIPDSSFYNDGRLPLSLQTSTAAKAMVSKNDHTGIWVDVSYLQFSASVLFTFTPVSDSTIESVIENRMERISLNLGGNGAEVMQFVSPDGFDSRVIVCRSVATPVQFLSTDGRSVVVSGAAYTPGFSMERIDSLNPVVDMLRRDIVHALKTLKND